MSCRISKFAYFGPFGGWVSASQLTTLVKKSTPPSFWDIVLSQYDQQTSMRYSLRHMRIRKLVFFAVNSLEVSGVEAQNTCVSRPFRSLESLGMHLWTTATCQGSTCRREQYERQSEPWIQYFSSLCHVGGRLPHCRIFHEYFVFAEFAVFVPLFGISSFGMFKNFPIQIQYSVSTIRHCFHFIVEHRV